jgi:hypothetical protein
MKARSQAIAKGAATRHAPRPRSQCNVVITMSIVVGETQAFLPDNPFYGTVCPQLAVTIL